MIDGSWWHGLSKGFKNFARFWWYWQETAEEETNHWFKELGSIWDWLSLILKKSIVGTVGIGTREISAKNKLTISVAAAITKQWNHNKKKQ